MPFNGSGVFIPVSLPGSWNPAITGQDATPADWNTLLADLAAAGLSNTITKDGQTTVTNDIPFGGHRLTNVGDPAADTDALNRQSTWYIFDQQSVVAQPFVDFISIPATVNNLMCLFGVTLSTTGALQLQTYGADGNLDTGASDYGYVLSALFSNNVSASSGAAAAAEIFLTNNLSSGSSGAGGNFTAANIQALSFTNFAFSVFGVDAGGALFGNYSGGGARQEADRITGVRLSPTVGLFTGNVTLYVSNA